MFASLIQLSLAHCQTCSHTEHELVSEDVASIERCLCYLTWCRRLLTAVSITISRHHLV